MKPSTNVRCTRKTAKNLKITTNGLEIEAKKEDYTIVDVKDIILLFQVFYMYTQIMVFLAAPGNKLQLQLVLSRYTKHLIILWKIYT